MQVTARNTTLAAGKTGRPSTPWYFLVGVAACLATGGGCAAVETEPSAAPSPGSGNTEAAPTSAAAGVATPATAPGTTVPHVGHAHDAPHGVHHVTSPIAAGLSATTAQAAPISPVKLELWVERRAPGIAATVLIQPPAGVTVTGQPLQQVLPASDPVGTRLLSFDVAFDTVPSDDLVVQVQAGDRDTWGFTATPTYRFGRPAPTIAEPPRHQTPTVLHGQSLGTAVQATPVRIR